MRLSAKPSTNPSTAARTLRRAVLGVVAIVALTLTSAPAAGAARPAAGAVSAPTVPAAATVATTRLAAFDAQLIKLLNNARKARGLPTVQEARGLTSLSVWWSNRMASGSTGYVLKHNPDAWSMLPDYGAASRTSWGENVAKFTRTVSAATIFNAYMNSPGHRANILNPEFRYVGMGTMTGSELAFNTMTFTDRVDPGQVVTPGTYVRGTLVVKDKAGKAIAGVRYSVRRGSCAKSAQVVQKTTAASGAFAMDLKPGAYCAIPTAWPHSLVKPPRKDWRVVANTSYKISVVVTRK